MKLALIGNPVKHSLSPKLYEELLGKRLESYDLLNYEKAEEIPSLNKLSALYDGINITSPYKQHFVNEIIIDSPVVKAINAVNTLSFTPEGVLGTNTDMLAVEEILQNYRNAFSKITLIVLGSGAMARLTELVAQQLNIPLILMSRKSCPELHSLDLNAFRNSGQNIIINACSRDFVFKGQLSKEDIFWDYNYSFDPHRFTIPGLVKTYVDGQEMLRLQAQAAVNFWCKTNPKLKC